MNRYTVASPNTSRFAKSAKDKDALKENGQKKNIELKKKEERKRRVRVIIEEYFNDDDLDLGDDDIVDAVGIAIWYWKVVNPDD